MKLERMREKWRPTLGLIIFAVLATVMILPLAGLFMFRLYDNQLIHQTQAELIAQSRVLVAVYMREVEARLKSGIALGPELPAGARPDPEDRFEPINPALDLASDDLRARRPDALPAKTPADAAYIEIGTQLMPIILETQKVTLAGFRILDPHGVVIAGRQETGLSLAHIEEVAAALRGQYQGALRLRISDKPPPPIYSLSRGTGLRVFSAMPVIVQNHIAGVVYASRTPSNIFKHLYQERGKVILAGIAVISVTILIGFIFSRTITRPMHELIGRAARIGRGDRDAFHPLRHHGTREFAQLSRSFLDMAGQVSRRSDYVATFASHLTHELKSPLTSIKGAAELLQDSLQAGSNSLTPAEQKTFLSNILSDAGRLETMANRLRELARAETAHQDGRTTLRPLIDNLTSQFPKLSIDASGRLDLTIAMSAENAFIVLSHLADNAARHHAKTVRLEVAESDAMIAVTVSNDGDPVSELNRDKIFDAFFTTRRDTGGTGMGLSIVRSMMTGHGGSISLLPTERGTAFEVRFPVG